MDEFLIWAAGFFDGEGCVGIYPGRQAGRVRWRLCLSVVQKDRRPLDLMRERFGGSISRKEDDRWVLTFGPGSASAFLREVRPHLRVKADQADVALEFADRLRAGKATTDEENAARSLLAARCSELKQIAA
jgi:hypothetical protein